VRFQRKRLYGYFSNAFSLSLFEISNKLKFIEHLLSDFAPYF